MSASHRSLLILAALSKSSTPAVSLAATQRHERYSALVERNYQERNGLLVPIQPEILRSKIVDSAIANLDVQLPADNSPILRAKVEIIQLKSSLCQDEVDLQILNAPRIP